MKLSRRAMTLAFVAAVAVATLAPITAAQATGSVGHTELVPEVPRLDTPRVTDGTVEDMVQWGDRIILAGNFLTVEDADGTPHNQPYMVAYNINTGLVDTSFDPVFDDEVRAMAVSADGNHLFVVGLFGTVNGVERRRVVKLDTNGDTDPTFVAEAQARTTALAVASDGSTLYIGGFFDAMNGVPRGRLAEVDPVTGATGPLDLPITEGLGPGANLKVADLHLTPDNNTLLVIHTGARVDGELREAIALVDTQTNSLLPWQTDLYTENLPRVGGVLRLTGGDMSPDGSYFAVVSGSGGDRPPINDTVIAFPVAGGAGVEPLWVSRHFDSLFDVAITEHALYIGGHFRWQEAPGSTEPWPGDQYTNYGWDAGIGAAALGDEVVRRDQIGALDPATGKSMNWNPGSNADVGVLALTAVERGLLVSHDNNILGGYDVGFHGFFDWDAEVNPEGPQTNITDPFAGFTITDTEVEVLGNAYAENGINFIRLWLCEGLCYGQGADGPFLQDDRVTFSDQLNSFDIAPDTPGQNSTWRFPADGLDLLDLPSGTYEVRARTFQIGGGNDASIASVVFDVDNDGDDPPITDITFPGRNDEITSNTFVITGTAADDVGVASVRLTLYDRETDWYLQDDGTLQDQFNAFTLPVEPAGGQVVNWEFEVTLPDGEYRFTANATDTAGQQDNAYVVGRATIALGGEGNEPPAVTIDSPVSPPDNEFVFDANTAIEITGTATDDVSVETVELRISNLQTGAGVLANGTFGVRASYADAVIDGTGTDVTWSFTTPNLPPGRYSVQARAIDDEGTRTGTRQRPTIFVISGVPGDEQPDTTIDWEERDQDIDTLDVAISGTATDDIGVDRVVVTIQETRQRQFLQGARFVTAAGTYDPLYTEIDAVLSGPATNRTWSLSGITLPEDGDYTITAKAIDTGGQYDIDQEGARTNWIIWPGDTDPYTWIQNPAPDSSHPVGSVIFDGRAFDDLVPFCSPGFDCGIQRVDLFIQNSAGLYMSSSGSFSDSERGIEVFLTNPTGQFSNWNYATPELGDDTYTVTARAQDLRYQYDQDIQTELTAVPGGEGSSLDQITIVVGTGVPPANDPELTLSVDAESMTFADSGLRINESFTLTNTGDVTLDGPFTVDTDQPQDPVTCPATASLAVGESVTCTASNYITNAEKNAGQAVTVATGSGSYDGGAVTSNQATLTLTYQPPAASGITFRAMTSLAKKGKWHPLTVPNQVQNGDLMLLFVTASISDQTFSTPSGWQRLATRDDDGIRSVVYWKVANASDAGKTVRVVLSSRRKANSVLVAYDGVDTANPVDVWKAAKEDPKTTMHRTPRATTSTPGTLVLSYWGERNNGSTTSMTAPGLTRYANSMSGNAAVTALLVETASDAAVGTYGRVTATANAASKRVTMWTIALRAE